MEEAFLVFLLREELGVEALLHVVEREDGRLAHGPGPERAEGAEVDVDLVEMFEGLLLRLQANFVPPRLGGQGGEQGLVVGETEEHHFVVGGVFRPVTQERQHIVRDAAVVRRE